MPQAPSTRLGLIGPSSSDLVSDGDDIIRALIVRLEAVGAAYLAGTAAARPAAAAGNLGYFYVATDTGLFSYSTGAAWIDINPINGAAGTPTMRKLGANATDATSGTDARLSDARTPLAHAASHAAGGSDALAVALATRSVLEPGIVGQTRAGRVLTVADFTTLLGLSQPVGLFNLGSLTNLGSGGALVNKGSVPFGVGITGAASEAAVFAGSTGQALYIADTGGADPFRIKAGSWGAWSRVARRGNTSMVLTKTLASSGLELAAGYGSGSLNVAEAQVQTSAAVPTVQVFGVSDVCDDRWHLLVATYDGAVLRLYVDGVLEGASPAGSGPLVIPAAPLNVGGSNADASTLSTASHFGRVDEAFVTSDVLNEDQIRMLYAVKIAHGFALTPRAARVSVTRRRRGGPYVTGDFTATPLRLYNFTAAALTDAGSNGQALTNNNTAPSVAGMDGQAGGAFEMVAASTQTLSATDTGLPAGTAARSFGMWMRAPGQTAAVCILSWGTLTTADERLTISAAGLIQTQSGPNLLAGPSVVDGLPHFVVVTEDNAAADGRTRKLYVDGRLVASDAGLNSITLAGAGKFRIGANQDASSPWSGTADGVFVTNYAMAADEVASLFAKGSVALGLATNLDDADLRQIVQGFDATNLYVVGDVRRRIVGRVSSDGSIKEAVGGAFSVVKSATGRYLVYFPPGMFSAPPVVHGSASATGRMMSIMAAPTAQVVDVGTTNGSTPEDWDFYFTAEGRGPLPSQHQLDLGVSV